MEGVLGPVGTLRSGDRGRTGVEARKRARSGRRIGLRWVTKSGLTSGRGGASTGSRETRILGEVGD